MQKSWNVNAIRIAIKEYNKILNVRNIPLIFDNDDDDDDATVTGFLRKILKF